MPHTILSSCQPALLGMFNTQSILPLRATCRDAAAAIAAHPWDDTIIIKGNLGPALLPPGPGALRGAWRSCFPGAHSASVSQRQLWFPHGRSAPVVDADFAHLEGLRALDLWGCTAFSSAAFTHLQGIRTLCLRDCNQAAITDAALAHLVGIRELDLSGCDLFSLTAAAAAPLRDLRVLRLNAANLQSSALFSPLGKLETLDMSENAHAAIADDAFEHLLALQELDVTGCTQLTDEHFLCLRDKPITELLMGKCPGLSDAALASVHGKLEALSIPGCSALTDAAFEHLRGIRSLVMSGCSQASITDAAFAHLAGIQSLEMNGCRQVTLTDAAFVPLAGIQSLDMSGCNQATITDAAFAPLAGIQSLAMSGCDQATITDAAFAPLAGIQSLDISCCYQVTDAGIAPLVGLRELKVDFCRQLNGVTLRLLGSSLVSLSARGCGFRSKKHIAALPLLRTLDISECRRLSSKFFSRLTMLESLTCTNVTPTSARDFARLQRLETVNVGGCGLQADVLEHLKRASYISVEAGSPLLELGHAAVFQDIQYHAPYAPFDDDDDDDDAAGGGAEAEEDEEDGHEPLAWTHKPDTRLTLAQYLMERERLRQDPSLFGVTLEDTSFLAQQFQGAPVRAHPAIAPLPSPKAFFLTQCHPPHTSHTRMLQCAAHC